MKGKHTNAAERRRHLDDLTSRAETAERKAARLEAELSDVRSEAERQIVDLRSQVAEMKRQRDIAASPEIDAVQEQNRMLRRRIEKLKAEWAGGNHAFTLLRRHASTALRNAGLSEFEIQMVWTRAKDEAAELEHRERDQGTDLAVAVEEAQR